MRLPLLAALAVAAPAALAWLGSGAAQSAAAPSPAEVFQRECGACHWAYLPSFLPARSWRRITSDLGHHFGQNASLDDATTRQITDYLVRHAADAPGSNQAFLRGVGAGDTPLRITDLPLWRAIHAEVGTAEFSRPGVKTKANCMGCHRG